VPTERASKRQLGLTVAADSDAWLELSLAYSMRGGRGWEDWTLRTDPRRFDQLRMKSTCAFRQGEVNVDYVRCQRVLKRDDLKLAY
jgi:hypothetical protein